MGRKLKMNRRTCDGVELVFCKVVYRGRSAGLVARRDGQVARATQIGSGRARFPLPSMEEDFLSVAGEEAGVGAGEVGAALAGEELAVNVGVADEHFKALFEGVADDLALLHVRAFGEGDAVGKRPGIALARDGAELIGDGEALFIGSDDGGEQFAGELAPEVVEEILGGAADAAVVIGCAEEDNVGMFHADAEGGEGGAFVRGIGIEKGERFFFKVENVHGAAVGLELRGDMLDDIAGGGGAVQTADDGEDFQCWF